MKQQKKEEVFDPNKFFNFQEAKVQNITLDQLKQTHQEVDVYGKPLKGMFHHEIITNVLDVAYLFGYNTEVWDLFAAHNSDRQNPGVVLLPQVEAIKGERAVEAHILRRVFANIRLKDFDTPDYTTNLSIAFHQRGVQVGFGNNVIICHNQCMLSPTNYAATYYEHGRENDKHELPELLGIVRGWLENARNIVERDRQRIERMKNVEVTPDKTLQLIGSLTALRVAHDTKVKAIRKSGYYPLNQSQIGDFTEDLLIRHNENGNVTVWDLYDAATNLYKADKMDMTAILPQNQAFVGFLEENFNI